MTFARVVFLALAAVGSVNAYSYGAYNTRSCTATNARCAGAPGKPFIKYAPCCESSKACMPKPNASNEEWGLYCVAPPTDHAGKCYKTGERCMGAPGKPYVAHRKCCNDGESCQKSDGDWGGFCKAGHAASPDVPPPVVGYDGKKCYETGARCMGEAGHPYVPYHGCCKSSDSCVKSTTTWGSMCSSESDPPATDAPTTTMSATDAPTTAMPATDAPTTAMPATDAPTTAMPATDAPTTAMPATDAPTTAMPATDAPTTAMPATEMPTMPKSYYTPPTTSPATTAGSSGLMAAFPDLPADFGCNSGSEAPAATSTQSPFNPVGEQGIIELSFPVDACATTTLTFTKEDADALCAALIAVASATDPSVQCRYTGVSAGTSGRALIQDTDMAVVDRQAGGVILFIELLAANPSLLAILLAVLGPLIALAGGTISALPLASPSA